MRIKLARNRWRLIGLLLGVASIVVLIAVANPIVTFIDGMLPSRELSWSTTGGTITHVDLYCNDAGDNGAYWEFIMEFTYEIDGSLHASVERVSWGDVPDAAISTLTRKERQYMFGDCSSKREDPAIAQAVSEKLNYQLGQPVVVYYNPENRGEAVTVPGKGPTIGLWIVLSLEMGLMFAVGYVLTKGTNKPDSS